MRERIELLPNSHKGKALQHILNNYPRDEMLQASVDELCPIIRGVLDTQERHHLRLFLRLDTFGRFATALVYVPRERFNTQLRIKMQNILIRKFNGSSVDFNVMFSALPLARVQLTVHGKDIRNTPFDIDDIEQQMRDAMLAWGDHLHHALNSKRGEAKGNQLFKQYGQAFPLGLPRKLFCASSSHGPNALAKKSVLINLCLPIYTARCIKQTKALALKCLGTVKLKPYQTCCQFWNEWA